MSAKQRGLRRFLGVAKLLFAASVLGLVLYNLPWQDRVLWIGNADELAFKGTIDGEWKSAAVRFVPAAGQTLPAELEALRDPTTGALSLTRAPEPVKPPPGEHRIDWRPGMPRVFRALDPRGLVMALLLFLTSHLCVVTRWWRLLAAAGSPAKWMDSLRLTGMGLFFNLVMPGITGGDLIKALLVAREHPEQKAAAIVSIIVDRAVGLLTMAAVAAAVILIAGETFAAVRTPVLVFLGAGLATAALMVNIPLRRVLGIEAVLARLPFRTQIAQLDEAIRLYSRHRPTLTFATVLSLVNHIVGAVGVMLLGRAFGESLLDVYDYTAVHTMATIVSSIPAAPAGWGVGEATYGYLFGLLGASTAIGVATSITYRLCQLGFSLLGGLFLLAPSRRVHLADVEELAPQA